MLFHFKNR